jgi:hypothetical protein
MYHWINYRAGKAVNKLELVSVRTIFLREHARLVVLEPILVYKKVVRPYKGDSVIGLALPVGALIVMHREEPKCRTNIALTGSQKGRTYSSMYDHSFEYSPWSIITTCDNLHSRKDWSEVCAAGIHFFFQKQQAEDYT